MIVGVMPGELTLTMNLAAEIGAVVVMRTFWKVSNIEPAIAHINESLLIVPAHMLVW